MRISLIVATAVGGVIGQEGDLPWRLSSDLRRFKRLTMGHHVIMGRRTYESLGRPLPGREMIVLTRQPNYQAPGAVVAADLPQALRIAASSVDGGAADAGYDGAADASAREVFIIGGAEVYRQALPRVDRLCLTRVQAKVAGDTHFPAVDWSQWRLIEEEHVPAGDRDEHESTFCIYDRVAADRSQDSLPTSQPASQDVSETLKQEILDLNQQLLDAIAAADWETYAQLCDPQMTSFEPEARGHIVEGLEFHRFYFEQGGHMGAHHSSILEPRVRLLGEAAALVTYVRLVQRTTADGETPTTLFEETRLWQRVEGRWRHVHFHRTLVE